MSHLPALCEALARHDPRGATLINYYARQVREADLIVSKKKGAGAAEMTFGDAAVLLMAVCGATNAVDGPAAVRRFRQIARQDLSPIDAQVKMGWREDLSFLSESPAFAATLERMIAKAPLLAEWEKSYIRSSSHRLPSMHPRMVGKQVNSAALSSLERPLRLVFYVPGSAAEVHLGRAADVARAAGSFDAFYSSPDSTAVDASLMWGQTLISFEVGTPLLLALHDVVCRASIPPRTRKVVQPKP